MKRQIRHTIALLLAAFLALSVAADDAGWRDSEGKPLADTGARRFANGFGAWLIARSSPATAPPSQSRARLADAVANEKRVLARGEALVPVIFVLNAGRDASGNADVSCGLRFTRPDGSEERSYALRCVTGPIEGGTEDLRQAPVPIEFFATPEDAAGTWSIEAVVYDRVRDRTITVATSFELSDAV